MSRKLVVIECCKHRRTSTSFRWLVDSDWNELLFHQRAYCCKDFVQIASQKHENRIQSVEKQSNIGSSFQKSFEDFFQDVYMCYLHRMPIHRISCGTQLALKHSCSHRVVVSENVFEVRGCKAVWVEMYDNCHHFGNGWSHRKQALKRHALAVTVDGRQRLPMS